MVACASKEAVNGTPSTVAVTIPAGVAPQPTACGPVLSEPQAVRATTAAARRAVDQTAENTVDADVERIECRDLEAVMHRIAQNTGRFRHLADNSPPISR